MYSVWWQCIVLRGDVCWVGVLCWPAGLLFGVLFVGVDVAGSCSGLVVVMWVAFGVWVWVVGDGVAVGNTVGVIGV